MDDAPAIYICPSAKFRCGIGQKLRSNIALALCVTALMVFTCTSQPARAQTQYPNADASAWALIRDTTDVQIPERFIAAHSTSPLAAQARAALLAARQSSQQGSGHTAQSAAPKAPNETFIGGRRLGGEAAAPGTRILRTIPAKPAGDALSLSPKPLGEWNNQLSSGAPTYFPGYIPPPRAVGVQRMPAYAPPVARAAAPVVARGVAHLALTAPAEKNPPQAHGEAIWRQIENSAQARVYQVSAEFEGTPWSMTYELRFLRATGHDHVMTLRATLEHRGPQPEPAIERLLAIETRAAGAAESLRLDGVNRRISERVFEFDVAVSLRNIEAIVAGEWMNVSFVLRDGQTMMTQIGKTGEVGAAMASALAWTHVR